MYKHHTCRIKFLETLFILFTCLPFHNVVSKIATICPFENIGAHYSFASQIGSGHNQKTNIRGKRNGIR